MSQHSNEVPDQSLLSDVLGRLLDEVGWSERQLAQRADIPRGTVRNWMKGAVARPRQWHPLIKAAAAMRLDAEQTDNLLQSAQHLPISELWLNTKSEEDKLLLSQFLVTRSHQENNQIFQAMPDLPYFVGREKELAVLKKHLLKNHHPTIYILNGMAGVGKTTLATRLAYEVRDYFTDGVLWARADTSDTMSLLKLIADSFGHDVSQYADLHSRSQAVRGLLAFKKALLVIDNVDSSSQAEHLLPPTGPCAVLVTTRQTNLRIARGCPQVRLEPFEPADQSSQALFVRILGEDAAEAEKKTLTQIADLLGHLPLALSIVAGRIALEPHTTAESYLTQLQAEKAGLDALTHEEQSVRASFNSSYAALTLEEQSFFAALGVFGGEDFGVGAVTAVTNTTKPSAQSTLTQLYSLSLVQTGKNQRYRLHPLLREYARAQIKDTAVTERMITHFSQYVAENQGNFRAIEQELNNILTALEAAFHQGLAAIGLKLTIDLADFLSKSGLRSLAKQLLGQAEQTAATLQDTKNLALIKCAQGHIEKGRTWRQAQTYFEEAVKIAYVSKDDLVIAQVLKEVGLFFYAHGDYDQAQSHWEKSLVLARRNENIDLQLFLYNYLAGIAVNHANDYYQAEKLFLEGLALQRQHQNLLAMSLHLMNLSMIAFSLGNYKQTRDYLQESEKIAEQIKYPLVQIILSGHRASLIVAREGDYAQAKLVLQDSLKMARELGDTAVTGFILARLGNANARLGQFGEAVVNLQEALLFSIETRRQDIEIEVLTCLGFIAGQQNQHKLAQSHFEKALILARSYNDKWFLGKTLAEWGEFNLAEGKWKQARQAFEELLTISQQSAFSELAADAQFGLARVAQAQSEMAQARRLGEQSRVLFAEIGHYQRQIVRTWLDKIPFSNVNWGADQAGKGLRPLN